MRWMKAAQVDTKDSAAIWEVFMMERFVEPLQKSYKREIFKSGVRKLSEAAQTIQRLYEVNLQMEQQGPFERKKKLNELNGKEEERRQEQSRQGHPGQDRGGEKRYPPAKSSQSSSDFQRRQGPHNQDPRPPRGQFNRFNSASMMKEQEGQGDSIYPYGRPESLCQKCAEKPLHVLCSGTVNGQVVNVLRDSGASTCVIRSDLVKEEDLMGEQTLTLEMANGVVDHVRRAFVTVDTPFLVGTVLALVLDNLNQPFVVGNSAYTESGQVVNVPMYANPPILNAVQTRAQKDAPEDQDLLGVNPKRILSEIHCSPQDFAEEQAKDPTLMTVTRAAKAGTEFRTSSGTVSYGYRGKVLVRVYRSSQGEMETQLCVPKRFRTRVLETAHDLPMSGHLAEKKTMNRVYSQFYWPRMRRDVQRFIRTCDVCQRTTPKGRTPKVPMVSMPVVDEPFAIVGVDIVGPLPKSSSGMEYILVVVDHATRYPEAIPLRSITARAVTEALVSIFTRMGIPKQMLTDQGTQFTGGLMKQVRELLGIRGIRTTAYHPQTNGVVERFNGTLKSMLRRLVREKPRAWDTFVAPALFAFREVPQESTGYSPFELMFGRRVRGPMAVLRDLWADDDQQQTVRDASKYVCELRQRITETCKLARGNLEKSSDQSKQYYDRKAKERHFQEGDSVLLLLPEKHNKLEMAWQGPYNIKENLGECNYRIQLPTGTKIVHANIIKKYHVRPPDHVVATIEEIHGDLFTSPEELPIGHCVSADMHMGGGIAAQFREKFGRQKELLAQGRKSGQLAVLQVDGRWLYYLVTKKRVTDKPTYPNLRRAVRAMFNHAFQRGLKHLALPRIGSGLDGLSWPRVRRILEEEAIGKVDRVSIYVL